MLRSRVIFVGLLLMVADFSYFGRLSALTGATTQSNVPSRKLLPDQPKQDEFPHLPNLIRVTQQIYSGAEPKGVEGFAALAKLGIKTIVSVDGAIPNVERAKAHRLHYVHIPIGYEEVSETEGKSLAALIRTRKGPFYIHCHHGRHRGPVAAAIVCIASGEADGKSAIAILDQAGTSKAYAGLWESVSNYAPPNDEEQLPQLVEVARPNTMVATMAQIDRQYDRLKLCQASGWRTPAQHPDLSPEQQALLLKESFRELRRSLQGSESDQLRDWMSESEALASQLLHDLHSPRRPKALDTTFKALREQCQRCHATWRNNPNDRFLASKQPLLRQSNE